jgi:hypothetical protein
VVSAEMFFVDNRASSNRCWTTRWLMTMRACRVTEAEDALVVTFDVVVCDSPADVRVRRVQAASGGLPSAGQRREAATPLAPVRLPGRPR